MKKHYLKINIFALVLGTILVQFFAPVHASDTGTGSLYTMVVATGNNEQVTLLRQGKRCWTTAVDIPTSYYDFYGWPTIEGALWISSGFPVEDPTQNSLRLFVKTFTIPGEVVSATINITADNAYRMHVNGRLAGSDGRVYGPEPEYGPMNWQSTEVYDLTRMLRSGSNKITVVVRNYKHWKLDGTWENNPTGLIFRIDITYKV